MFCNHWLYSSLEVTPFHLTMAISSGWSMVSFTSREGSKEESGPAHFSAQLQWLQWLSDTDSMLRGSLMGPKPLYPYVSMVYHQIKGIQGILVHNWGHNPNNPMNTVLGSVSIAGVRSKPRQAAAKRVCSQAGCCLPISQYETHHLAGLTTHLHPFMAIWLYS